MSSVGDRRLQECVRKECEYCELDATLRIAYLLAGARTNPASSGFEKDDISWCSDADAFTCEKHKGRAVVDAPNGMEWCSTMSFEKLPHLFVEWRTIEEFEKPI